MGWSDFFRPGDSAKSPTSSDNASTKSIGLTEEQRNRIFGPPRTSPPSSSPTPTSKTQTATREHTADVELENLIKEFQASEAQSLAASQNTALPAQSHNEPKQHERILPNGTLDISPSALYPRTMSCRQQFDQAYYCQSFGGQLNAVYRYGGMKSCSEQWEAFWFCMRNRTLGEKEKEGKIREFYRKRDERRRREGGNSEDVWELRTTALERAFWKDPFAEEGEGKGKVQP